MLSFWLIAAVITAGVVTLLLRPLLKAPAPLGERAAFDLEVYRDQLRELERDVERGMIPPEQAASARAEIGRRMLAVDAENTRRAAAETAAMLPPADPHRGRWMAAVLAVLIPVGVLAVYLSLGNPDLPARPLALRDIAREKGLPPPDVVQAVASLKAKLATNPDDVEGWALLARASTRMGEWPDAVIAYRNLVRLHPADADPKAGLAESLISLGGGLVSAEARDLLQAVVHLRPDDPRARYYLALGKRQSGDNKGALADWQALMAATPADAPWLDMVRRRIGETAGSLGLDVAAATPTPLPAAEPHPQPATEGAAGGTAAGAGTAAGGDAGGREKMIRGMVQQLADKLKTQPDDVEGWLRLARSYSVLGEHDKAQEAAHQAIAHAPKRVDGYLALADALLGAAGKPDPDAPLPDGVAGALRQVLDLDANNRDALWMLGKDAANRGRKDVALTLWTRLLAQFDDGDPDRAFVKQRIDALR